MTAAGAVCGEALLALLGVMLSDPRVTWPAITNVLPAAVAYDVLLCPFVLYAVAAALRLAGARGEARRPGWSPSQARTPAAGRAARARSGSWPAGAAPRLRLSERDRGTGSIGGLRGPGADGPRPGVSPSSSWAGVPARLGAAFAPAALGAGGGPARVKFGGRRREGVLGGSLLGGARSGSSRGLRHGSRRAERPQVRQLEHGPVAARRLRVQPQPRLRAGPARRLRPVRAPRPDPRRSGTGATRRAAGWPGTRPGSPAAARWPGCTGALRRSGRAEVAGPGLAARHVLARRLTAAALRWAARRWPPRPSAAARASRSGHGQPAGGTAQPQAGTAAASPAGA